MPRTTHTLAGILPVTLAGCVFMMPGPPEGSPAAVPGQVEDSGRLEQGPAYLDWSRAPATAPEPCVELWLGTGETLTNWRMELHHRGVARVWEGADFRAQAYGSEVIASDGRPLEATAELELVYCGVGVGPPTAMGLSYQRP